MSSFAEYMPKQGPRIELGDDTTIPSIGKGTVKFKLNDMTVETKDILHVPNLSKNLFSIGQSTGMGIKYLLDGDKMTIYSKESFVQPQGKVIATIPKGADNLYHFTKAITRPTRSEYAKFAK